mmetsp:Transcript_74800/g.178553  ORF Transcript_74800/g.178553 Transcript_74800/m.178553 type:complete len:205 (-) Transcript_74800:1147-1761(-)
MPGLSRPRRRARPGFGEVHGIAFHRRVAHSEVQPGGRHGGGDEVRGFDQLEEAGGPHEGPSLAQRGRPAAKESQPRLWCEESLGGQSGQERVLRCPCDTFGGCCGPHGGPVAPFQGGAAAAAPVDAFGLPGVQLGSARSCGAGPLPQAARAVAAAILHPVRETVWSDLGEGHAAWKEGGARTKVRRVCELHVFLQVRDEVDKLR